MVLPSLRTRRPGRVAMAYFFEKTPSLSRKTGAPSDLPARQASIAGRSSSKSTVTTLARGLQRPARGLTRSTMSRERGDQVAQTTPITVPWASSAPPSRSLARLTRWISWAEAGRPPPGGAANRAAASNPAKARTWESDLGDAELAQGTVIVVVW